MSALGRVGSAIRDFFLKSQEATDPPPPDEPPIEPSEAIAKLREAVGDEFFAEHPVAVEQIAKAFAQPVPQMPATPATEPVGSPGVGIVGAGYIHDNETNADLRGAARYKNFETWKRIVAEVGLGVRLWLILCGAPKWIVKPYKADDANEPLPEDVKRAAWMQRQIDDLATEWPRVVMEHSLAPIDGARLGVWTAKEMPPGDLGTFGLADIMTIPLSSIEQWDVDPSTGHLRGVVQRDPDSLADIPIARSRLVYSRDLPTTTHPAGDGVMRFLAETIRKLLAHEKLLDKGFERDVNGIPVIYAPIIEKLKQIGKALDGGGVYTRAMFDAEMREARLFISAEKRKDAGLILDSSTVPNLDGSPSTVRRFGLEVLTAQATSHAELRARIKDLGWAILAALGCEHKAMGRDNGTQGMHISKERGQIRAVSSFLNGFAVTVRRDIAKPLWILNGWDPTSPKDPRNLPTFEWSALEFADTGAAVQAITALAAAALADPRLEPILAAVIANQGLPPMAPRDEAAEARAREDALDRAGVTRKPAPDDGPDPLDDEPDPED